jgi:hypothetical protein
MNYMPKNQPKIPPKKKNMSMMKIADISIISPKFKKNMFMMKIVDIYLLKKNEKKKK